MSDLDLDKLEAVAEAAIEGEWSTDERALPRVGATRYSAITRVVVARDGEHEMQVSSWSGTEANATHIATFDPPTVLALIAEVRLLRKQVDVAVKALNVGTCPMCGELVRFERE